MTPRSPTRIADSSEPELPVRLADTLPEPLIGADSDGEFAEDSPSKQLYDEANRLNVGQDNESDVPDDNDEIPRRPLPVLIFLRKLS
jgi:hypothetical protein